MNKTYREAKDLVQAIEFSDKINPEVKVILAVPALYLSEFKSIKLNSIKLAAQNCHYAESGAYTGEISAGMLASINVGYCIVGHSERRQYFGETDEDVNKKVHALLKEEIVPIVCIGEKLEDRKSGKHIATVLKQCKKALDNVDSNAMTKLILAYEPIWAIGTGETATADQAEEMHAAIRNWISEQYDDNCGNGVNILYGGSCNPANGEEIFSKPNVDGGLIGGASLKSVDFLDLTNCF